MKESHHYLLSSFSAPTCPLLSAVTVSEARYPFSFVFFPHSVAREVAFLSQLMVKRELDPSKTTGKKVWVTSNIFPLRLERTISRD